MNTRPKTKKLTISLLCCGRPDTTEKCLASLMKLRNAVDSEIIVVDTGCTPETRAIVDRYADEVLEFNWCNDFAKARNVQLDAANGEWFMYVDDDEYFVEYDDIIDFFNSGEYKRYGYGGYRRKNYLDFDGSQWSTCRIMRMVKVTPDVKFIGKIHEHFTGYSGNGIHFKALMDHYGYCYASEEEYLAHKERNVSLIKVMMEEEPNELFWPFQLVQEYNHNYEEDMHELLNLCNKYLYSWKFGENEDRYISTFTVGKMEALESLHREDEALEWYNKNINNEHVFNLTKANMSVYATNIYFNRLDFSNCYETCKYYFKLYDVMHDDEFAKYQQSAILTDKTFDEDVTNVMYMAYITSDLRMGRLDCLGKHCDSIQWNSKFLQVRRAYVQVLLEAAVNHGFSIAIQNAFKKFLINETLTSVLKNEISDCSMQMPKSLLEKLMTYFDENSQIYKFINAQKLRKENPDGYMEMYRLEEQVLAQVAALEVDGKLAEADSIRNQLKSAISTAYGVESLR